MVRARHRGGAGHRRIFFNVTNFLWITALGLIFALMRRDLEAAAGRVADGALLILAGLTGPLFSGLLAPLFVTGTLMRRTRASRLIAGAVATTAKVQGWFICHPSEFSDPWTWRWANLVGMLSVRLPMMLARGE